ncbi:AfsR/SARP family transcriptional regulator [Mycetocola spongiae]|uniref:AfsR/SARP family transcriptional regulator n=1 Tax=Mycetocola spongiae TaxID=2859226 RepID=UPI001CF51BF9|nr:AfsR/SARP family transcriptional regulator [Mycetocola spongiae]UCR88091.1 AfsR/SARP family transcriptional regulator [Mycetocola spongiae]
MQTPLIRVLGPIEFGPHGSSVPGRPRHREILGLLAAARGRPVSMSRLREDLWDEPETGSVGAVQTFIGELRRALEPGRPARTPPQILVSSAMGYALRLSPADVDLWHAESLLAAAREAEPLAAEGLRAEALSLWRGGAFEEFRERPWARAERAHLAEVRAGAMEELAYGWLQRGENARAVPELEEHVASYPWREEGWRLLALALHRGLRRAEALETLRRARAYLADSLGLDPGRALADLELSILRSDPALDLATSGTLLADAAAAHSHTGARTRLESASSLLPRLAVSGGLRFAEARRIHIIAAAEEFNDPQLTARIIGDYDVPGAWTRSDDPERSDQIVTAALRTLARLPPDASARVRARLLAVIAMESRGTASRSAEAHESERLARGLGDPALICFALAARVMQEFGRCGLAAEREALAAELTALAVAAELPTFEIYGRLSRMQALSALSRYPEAISEAESVEMLALLHERPLATVLTAWFRYGVLGTGDEPAHSPEMPGFSVGLPELRHLVSQDGTDSPGDADFGPLEPWARPLVLAHAGALEEARGALNILPDPPADLLREAAWVLVAQASLLSDHAPSRDRARAALLPAATERAAGSGVVDAGPIAPVLAALAAASAPSRA